MKRIRKGYFYSINPFNSRQVKGYSLLPEDVDAIVFWTKNPKPFVKYIDAIDALGYDYYFQFTLNDYPKVLEPSMAPVKERIENFRGLSQRLGKERVIWRYDPIILSSISPLEYHIDKMEEIAQSLKGYTERLVISFLDFYGKVKNRLKKLETNFGIKFRDLTIEAYRAELYHLAQKIQEIAIQHEMEVYTCAEAVDLKRFGIQHGSCIDEKLIKELFKINKSFPKDRKQRNECLCAESVDVGVYNTCRAQCTYCYANYNEKAICNNLRKHFLDSPSLINRYAGPVKIQKDRLDLNHKTNQIRLF